MHRKPKRIKKKKSVLRTKLFWIFLLCVALLSAVVYVAVYSKIFTVQVVEIRTDNQSLQTNLRDLALQAVEGHIAFVSTRSILFVNSKAIEAAMRSKFPEIASVRVHKIFPHTLEIMPQERSVAALWCNTQTACFAIDSTGVMYKEQKPEGEFVIWNFLQNSSLSENVSSPSLGEIALSKALLVPLLDFKVKAEKLIVFADSKITFASASLVSEMQIQYKTSEDWQVFLDPTLDVAWQLTKLQTVLEQKIPPSQRIRLDYIDLRFGNQAYVKYR